MKKLKPMLYEPLTYSKKVREANYLFEMRERTQLGQKTISNNYSLRWNFYMIARMTDEYDFQCTASDWHFELDETLKKQQLMLLELSELTQHLRVDLNTECQVTNIFNYKEVWKKWQQLKIKLKQRHHGAQAQGYLDAIDKKMEDKQKLIQDMQQYRMLGMIFNGLHGVYFNGRQKFMREYTHHNVVHCLPVYISETVSQTPHLMETDPFRFELTGVMKPIEAHLKTRMEKYFRYYSIDGGELSLERYEGHCTINSMTGWMDDARLSIFMSNHTGYEREFHYHLQKLDDHE